MAESLSGLKWRRVDLHVHTPASLENKVDKSMTPPDIIKKAKEMQLDAICVSDHNTGDWVDLLKKAAIGSGVTVFGGVEITAQGGERNIHILAIFDPSKGTLEINDLLSQLKLTKDKRGRTDVLAEGDVNQVINTIAKNDGIPCLAHADSESGVLKEIKGVARTQIVQNTNLLGAQITNDETIKYLDGTDAAYRRKLATFRASDAHNLSQIGSDVSCFKMGDMSIHSLRQCFYDPDIRIKAADFPQYAYPRIVSMEFTQGFLEAQKCDFHEGLNSIIGGKGVGKSLIIEFLRFVLNQPSDIGFIREDMSLKLEKQLGIGGSVVLQIVTQSGASYRITRFYDGEDNPITLHNIAEDTLCEADIRGLFPILAYSQNEIIDISRDPAAQLKLIDRLIDIYEHNRTIENIRTALRDSTREYVESLNASEECARLLGEIKTAEEEIKELNKILEHDMFKLKEKYDRRKSALDSAFEEASTLKTVIQKFIDEQLTKEPPTPLQEDMEDIDFSLTFNGIRNASKKLKDTVQNAADEYSRALAEEESEHRKGFEVKLAEWNKEYQAFLTKIGGQEQALANKRTTKQRQLEQLRSRYSEVQNKAAEFVTHAQERDILLNDLQNALAGRHKARADFYQWLTDVNSGRLRLTIEPGADRTSYSQAVEELAKRTRIRGQSLRSVTNNLTPREFVDLVIKKGEFQLANASELSPESAHKLIDAIWADETKTQDCLAIPYECIPEDVPKIEYLKEDGKFYPLSELSIGQKCTALLLIALSAGTMPIVIDQPEDALDVATVYQDVVSVLRGGKENRQFILTTHNPNIAVSSDSDKYHVLKATESKGQIVCCGAIDLKAVRDAVIGQLEGGIAPYTLRGKKYGLGTPIQEGD